MQIPFWSQEQAKLLSIVNLKFTLITLSKSLLYGTVPCNTQELECKTINILLYQYQQQAVFEKRYTRCRIRNMFSKTFSTLQYSCSAPLLKILEKYF